MRRLVPESLRGQILLAVLLALAVAQGIAAVITVAAREEAVRAAQMGDALDRTAALIFVLERTDADLHRTLLRAVEPPGTRFSVDPQAAVPGTAPELSRMARRLGQSLGDGTPRDLRLRAQELTRERDDDDDHGPRRGRLAASRLEVSVALDGGAWLNARIGLPPPDRRISPLSLASFALSAAAIGAVLWLTLSRLLGPLRGLAGAAERLGRGEDVGALPVTGPSEMQALTEAFNRMQERLHRMVTDRTQMLAALGHDLRSPLTALRVRTEMVDDDETRERLLVSLAEMQEMVEQTLTYARGVWTSEAVETVEAGEFVAGFTEGLPWPVPVARPAGPLPLRIRPATLRRALQNLVDNARRYGGDGVGMTVRGEPDTVVIEIADHGPGIPEAELAHVFDPFVRLEQSRSRETGGAGLGLSIARSIIKAHGGDVVLANREGGGLLATVRLPRPREGEG